MTTLNLFFNTLKDKHPGFRCYHEVPYSGKTVLQSTKYMRFYGLIGNRIDCVVQGSFRLLKSIL